MTDADQEDGVTETRIVNFEVNGVSFEMVEDRAVDLFQNGAFITNPNYDETDDYGCKYVLNPDHHFTHDEVIALLNGE